MNYRMIANFCDADSMTITVSSFPAYGRDKRADKELFNVITHTMIVMLILKRLDVQQ